MHICPFRYLWKGRSFCALAIEESRYTMSEVIPATCAGCVVPRILAETPCGRMDLGVEIAVHAGRQNVEMHYASCQVTVERLFDLSGCTREACPYWEPWNEEEAARVRERALAARAAADSRREDLREGR
jgi:hypothetical protein